jgi:hypothetical protein
MPPSILLNFRNNCKICVKKNIIDHYVNIASIRLTCMAFFLYGKISMVIKVTTLGRSRVKSKTTTPVRTYVPLLSYELEHGSTLNNTL